MNDFNINVFLFSNVRGIDKVITIKALDADDIKRVNDKTLFTIVNTCKNDNGDFRVARERRKGNNWNSQVEGLYISNNHMYFDIYAQNLSTDTTYSEDVGRFFSGSSYRAYVERLGMYVNYSDEKRVEVMRSFLLEYVYYTDIEREERELKEKIAGLLHYSIVNPVLDGFFEELRLQYVPTHVKSAKRDGYYRGSMAITEYVNNNYKDLFGLSKEELQAIYRRVFRKAYNEG